MDVKRSEDKRIHGIDRERIMELKRKKKDAHSYWDRQCTYNVYGQKQEYNKKTNGVGWETTNGE